MGGVTEGELGAPHALGRRAAKARQATQRNRAEDGSRCAAKIREWEADDVTRESLRVGTTLAVSLALVVSIMHPAQAREVAHRCASAKHRRSRDGFSLVELIAVVAIMFVLAAAASPAFVAILRDRRVNNAAMKIVNYYRTAKMMAVGRGLPILVNWNSAGNLSNTNPGSPGLIQLIEPVLTTGTTPPSTCSQVTWAYFPATLTTSAAVNGVQLVDSFDLKNGSYDYTSVAYVSNDPQAASPSSVDICFSPSGVSFVRYGAGAFNQLLVVPSFQVTNVMSNVTRNVFIPPNGVARLGL